MYNASDAFHTAVENDQPQIVMLIFKTAVFTNEDIDVESGVEFNDYFNLEEDMAIGQSLSNEIRFSLFNDEGYLNKFKFGDFLATIGVLIETESFKQYGNVTIKVNNVVWSGFNEYPYITRNNTALSAQPSFAVKSLLCYEDKVYAFGADKQYVVYDMNGVNITQDNPVNTFMRNKSTKWEGKGFYYKDSTRILNIYEGGYKNKYEFVPLGHFTAERPKAPDTIVIDMSCNDYMVKFDQDMPTKEALDITYPISFKNLLKKMCSYAKVEVSNADFINSNAVIQEEIEDFSRVTMREVIQWIAEAAGGNAKFDRDGVLHIDWIRETNQKFDESKYESFNPYWYETKTITKLTNMGSDGSYDADVGTGSETYLIQDNPLLKGVT